MFESKEIFDIFLALMINVVLSVCSYICYLIKSPLCMCFSPSIGGHSNTTLFHFLQAYHDRSMNLGGMPNLVQRCCITY